MDKKLLIGLGVFVISAVTLLACNLPQRTQFIPGSLTDLTLKNGVMYSTLRVQRGLIGTGKINVKITLLPATDAGYYIEVLSGDDLVPIDGTDAAHIAAFAMSESLVDAHSSLDEVEGLWVIKRA